MSNKRTVILLGVLLQDAKDEEKKALSQQYQEAFKGTKEFEQAQQLLNHSLFVGARGDELLKMGRRAVERGISQTDAFEDSMASLIYVLETAGRYIEEAKTAMGSIQMDYVELPVILKSDDKTLRSFLQELTRHICYYTTVFYGPEALSEFRFDPDQCGVDMLKTVNASLIGLMNLIRRNARPRAWRILKKDFFGGNIVNYSGVQLEYLPDNQTPDDGRTRISPYLFQGDAQRGELCTGYGFISNLTPDKGLSVLSMPGGVVTKLDDRCFDKLDIPYIAFDPVDVLTRALDNRICSVTPEQYVHALNRRFMTGTVRYRQQNGLCPFCGKPTGTTCREHFAIPRNDFNVSMQQIAL